MNKTCTIDDLILYIYKECCKDESKKIRYLIQQDRNIKREYLRLKEIYKQLNNLKHSPSNYIINNILNFSKHSQYIHN